MTNEEVPWKRLNRRLVWVNATRFILSLLPSAFSIFVLETATGWFEIAPFVFTTTIGVIVSTSDFLRWLRTRYRITDELVEIHSGRIFRKYRSIPRERIRTVDKKAKLRHRLSGLRVVVINSGGSSRKTTVKLDAVTTAMADDLRRELMGSAALDAEERPEETPIARVRWYWVFYNMMNVWVVITVAFVPLTLYPFLQLIDINIFLVIRDGIDWNGLGLGWSIVLAGGAVTVVGALVLVAQFAKDHWNFELVRTTTEDGTALLTRQGLFSTREITREDRRIRGIRISEPLLWRWMGLTETLIISTGLSVWSLSDGEAASAILPRAPISEVRRVAGVVLRDESRPLEAPLRRHPRAALARRLIWALALPAFLSGLVAWLEATNALPAGLWAFPLCAVPLTLLFAFIAYRALGHAHVGRFLVVRCGLARRSTTVLQHEGVIGWKLRQSIFQRRLGLMNVGVATAGGYRFYETPDFGMDQVLGFTGQATPALFEEFLDREAGSEMEIAEELETVAAKHN
ncbi:PH domain-containing protein [Streptomyces sp. MN03-5084-2B]|nr:PH domain-containing protein [Streptomyces sp. MN03-5084-2B]